MGVYPQAKEILPSYLAISPYSAVRQRHYRTLLASDPRADARDPRWTTQPRGAARLSWRHISAVGKILGAKRCPEPSHGGRERSRAARRIQSSCHDRRRSGSEVEERPGQGGKANW
jgi:hypothetical protein